MRGGFPRRAGECMDTYDRIIIGAGLYGLYAALFCAARGDRVCVLECDSAAFSRATYINQARVHQGYHYPRSLSTAVKSAGYFARFNKDFDFCINRAFDKIYATSSAYSWSDGAQFKKFCHAAGIPCEELHPERFFRPGLCDGAFLVREYTYDAAVLRDYYLEKLAALPNAVIKYGSAVSAIENTGREYEVRTKDSGRYRARFVLNASYASANQIISMLGFECFKIKYELCEIILCKAGEKLSSCGITVMDGPFFSVMPFGMTGLHSLTSVTFTPHTTSYEALPQFSCQAASGGTCSPAQLANCNTCPARPTTAYPYMSKLAGKYLRDEFSFEYESSLFSMKPILLSSEIDDSRPTVIRTFSTEPTFVSVLSGKINTVYDLDEVLING